MPSRRTIAWDRRNLAVLIAGIVTGFCLWFLLSPAFI
jgi:hypothetical protein